MATDQTPPGPRGLPVLGNTHQWARDPCGFRERLADRYGDVVSYRLLGWDAYMVTDPAEVRRILVTEHDRFPKHEDSNAELTEILGDGLLTSEGAAWRRQREAIQPAFTMDHIRRYADIMVQRSAATADGLSQGDPVEMRECMSKLTLEIIVEAMFGPEIDLAERGIYDAVEAFRTPMQPRYQPVTFFAPDWAPIPFLRRADEALAHLEDQVYDILDERRRDDAARDDLLSMLLSAEADMADEQIRDEMLTFLFAGHETTALSLTFFWDLLTRNPDAAARVREELDETLEGRPGFGDLPSLQYTEAAIQEAMRLYPPAHEIRREPAEDVEIGGYRVPEGSLLVLPTWVLHRDERFWEDPEAFRPERFLDDEAAADRPDFAYFPFGGGPRHCIGKRFAMLEAQLIVATLAREWRFEREYGALDLAAAVTLQPSHDVPMTPVPR